MSDEKVKDLAEWEPGDWDEEITMTFRELRDLLASLPKGNVPEEPEDLTEDEQRNQAWHARL